MSKPVPEPPPHFFKYRALGTSDQDMVRLVQMLEEGQVYWPSPTQFNDPFDCAPVYEFPRGRKLKKMAVELHKRNFPNATRQERRQFVTQATKGGFYTMGPDFKESMYELLRDSSVYSLATDPQELLMWAHYSNSHKGVCVRLNTLSLVNSFPFIAPVKYEGERPSIAMMSDQPEDMLVKTLLTKSNHWAYEKEWRILGYKESRGLRKFSKNTVDGIVLGSRIEDDDRTFLTTLIERLPTPVALYQAACDNTVFKINLEPLNAQAKAEVDS